MRRSRRLSKNLDDQPGLFDEIESADSLAADDFVVDTVAKTVERLRSQTADNEAGELGMAAEAAVRPSRLMFVSFGSGSSGNCAYIGTHEAGVLLDAGVDAPVVMERLAQSGIDFKRCVRGIILTHDHSDHVRAAYPLLRRYPDKVLWATPRTLNGVLRRHNISRRIKDFHKPIYKEFEFTIGPLTITPFETSHDGTDNVGFCVRCGSETLVVATDMGYATERALHYMAQATVLMVESNYDAHMLATGHYPLYLQARIRGDRGHMDNAETARVLAGLWRPQLHHVLLCHLSHDNNTPELALAAVAAGLQQAGAEVGRTVQLDALPRFDASRLYVF